MPYLSIGQATNDAMRVAMRLDPSVIVLGEDIRWGGSFGQFRGLYEEFGDRVIDMPISEAIIVAVSVGAAARGMRPVASMSFVEFSMGAMDELVNQAAKLRYMFGGQAKVPFVLRCADGTIRSAAAQHSESLEALFAHIPGLKVVAPSNAYDAKGLLLAAIADDNPVIYLENKKIQPSKAEVPEGLYEIPLGAAAVRREGRDLTIIAYSVQAVNAAEAAERLAKEGIEAEVIDLRTPRPPRHRHRARPRSARRAGRSSAMKPGPSAGSAPKSRRACRSGSSTVSTRRSSGSARGTPTSRSRRCSSARSFPASRRSSTPRGMVMAWPGKRRAAG